MATGDQTPAEDLYLCKHEYLDVPGGFGVDKDNPRIVLVAFYCKHCLLIRVKSYDQSRYTLSREWITQYKEDQGALDDYDDESNDIGNSSYGVLV